MTEAKFYDQFCIWGYDTVALYKNGKKVGETSLEELLLEIGWIKKEDVM